MSPSKTSARTNDISTPRNATSGRDTLTLTGTIDAYLARSREADSHVIARRLLAKVTEHHETILLAGLAYLVRQRIHVDRHATGLTPSAGPSKWSVVKRVPVLGKLLEDCDVSDLEALAEDYRRRAGAMLARADEVEQLADQLRASGCGTVGEMWAATEALAA